MVTATAPGLHVSSTAATGKTTPALTRRVGVKDKGVLLSALVVHFMDDGITPRFYESAVLNGLLSVDASDAERKAFHAEMLAKVYDAYANVTVPADLSEMFPSDDEADEQADLDA